MAPSFCLFVFCLYVSDMRVFYLHVCLCTVCLPAAYGGQERTSVPLKVELQVAVSHYMGAGT